MNITKEQALQNVKDYENQKERDYKAKVNDFLDQVLEPEIDRYSKQGLTYIYHYYEGNDTERLYAISILQSKGFKAQIIHNSIRVEWED